MDYKADNNVNHGTSSEFVICVVVSAKPTLTSMIKCQLEILKYELIHLADVTTKTLHLIKTGCHEF